MINFNRTKFLNENYGNRVETGERWRILDREEGVRGASKCEYWSPWIIEDRGGGTGRSVGNLESVSTGGRDEEEG